MATGILLAQYSSLVEAVLDLSAAYQAGDPQKLAEEFAKIDEVALTTFAKVKKLTSILTEHNSVMDAIPATKYQQIIACNESLKTKLATLK